MALRIFISHSHKDAGWCDSFVEQLTNYDLDIWYDRQGLYAGSQWLRTIEDELMNRDIFLVVLTPESWASEWVREELALALAAKKRIVGVMMKQTQVSGFIIQRQMLNVVGQNAATAAQTVATGLGMQTRATGAPRQWLPSPVAKSNAPSVEGEWYEANDAAPWTFELTQNGQALAGAVAVGARPSSKPDEAHSVTGRISGEEITIEYDLSTSIHYVFRLRLVEGKLVGTKRASNFSGTAGLDVTLLRR